MKSAPFLYARPSSVAEVCDVLAQHGDDAKLLSGGQSLMPLLNLRLAAPEVIVDINRVAELDRMTDTEDEIGIGALVRQRQTERSPVVLSKAPLLAEALHWVGHLGVRNRGTVAGSIAHADPAAELPAVLIALQGSVRAVSARAQRVIPASDLFESYFTTTLEPEEIITEVRVPWRAPRTGHSWVEFAQRHGDYAIVGMAAALTLDEAGVCRSVRLVCSGVDSVPYDASSTAAMLEGTAVTPDGCREVAERIAGECSPGSDGVADADFRRRLVRALIPDLLLDADRRAKNGATVGD